jgi:hypothetical protein
MSNLPSYAQLRNWLAPLPDAKLPVAADVLTFSDTSINYGSRARVRIYRPEGVYEIDNSQAGTAPATEGNRDSESTPDQR